jgi:hypothetical protein
MAMVHQWAETRQQGTGTRRAGLALGHTSTATLFNNAARPANNSTAIIEWVVDDVEAEYERLLPVVSEWEQEPTLMPWGNRSILFRDPDGNLVKVTQNHR